MTSAGVGGGAAETGRIFKRVLRGVLVGGAVVGGAVFAHLHPRAEEIGYVLADVGAMGVSFLAAQWFIVLVANGVLGAAWLGLSFSRGRWLFWRLLVAFVARQVGHLEALFLWIAILLSLLDRGYEQHPRAVLALRLTLVVVLVGYGAPGIDLIAQWVKANRGKRPMDGVVDVRFHEVRRWVLSVFTLLAFGFLYRKAPDGMGQLYNLFFALAVGMMGRLGQASVAKRTRRRGDGGGLREAAYDARLVRWADNGDHVIRAVAVVGLPVLLGISQLPSIQNHESDASLRSYWRISSPESPPKETKSVSLFIVSDSQFHEVGGKRAGTHLDLASAVVPVSVRPIELDLLSGATLAHFGDIYAELRKTRPDMQWAHLGDFADLGCVSEMKRAERHLAAFGGGTGRLAALMPGNHDSTFIGNFTWHPEWSTNGVCKSGVLWKDAMNAGLLKTVTRIRGGDPDLHPDPDAVSVKHRSSRWDHRAALAWVTRLGELDGHNVVGVFLDTSDYTGLTLGVDGIQGSISSEQADAVMKKLDEDGSHPWVLLLMHHPYDELSRLSHGQIAAMTRHFGVERLVGIISAHTHFAARRLLKIDGADIPELVVGSTIDPPQEAALLEISSQPGEKPSLRLRTIQAVLRPHQACLPPNAADITSKQCADIFDELDDPRISTCKMLFVEANEQTTGTHFTNPGELATAQQESAERLLKCIFRKDTISVPEDPLAEEWAYSEIDKLEAQPEREKELVCLSWAASVLQGRKQNGWRFNQALAMSLEQGATFGAVEMRSVPPPKEKQAEWTCRDAPPSPAGATPPASP